MTVRAVAARYGTWARLARLHCATVLRSTVPRPRDQPPTRNLWENIERLKLDVQTVLPIHGRMVKVDELKLEAGVQ